MSFRTTPDAVQGILGGNYNSKINLEPFIDVANELTTQVYNLASANKGLLLSASLLEKIERNLAAHFYGFQDQFYQTKGTGKASATFQGTTGAGLQGSFYGQTAVMLDTTRTLAAIDKGGMVGLDWLGTAFENACERSSQ